MDWRWLGPRWGHGGSTHGIGNLFLDWAMSTPIHFIIKDIYIYIFILWQLSHLYLYYFLHCSLYYFNFYVNIYIFFINLWLFNKFSTKWLFKKHISYIKHFQITFTIYLGVFWVLCLLKNWENNLFTSNFYQNRQIEFDQFYNLKQQWFEITETPSH